MGFDQTDKIVVIPSPDGSFSGKGNVARIFGLCKKKLRVFRNAEMITLLRQCVYQRAESLRRLVALVQAKVLSNRIGSLRFRNLGAENGDLPRIEQTKVAFKYDPGRGGVTALGQGPDFQRQNVALAKGSLRLLALGLDLCQIPNDAPGRQKEASGELSDHLHS